jgi:hypothetical protein
MFGWALVIILMSIFSLAINTFAVNYSSAAYKQGTILDDLPAGILDDAFGRKLEGNQADKDMILWKTR